MQKKLNKVLYDSIFKAMFRGIDDNNENEELNLQIKKDFLEFYKKYCNPSSELQPEDIQPFNLLEKKIFSDYHNDLAYLVKGNRLIALFEHQTTYNPNMPSRLFSYYSMLLNKFWKEKKEEKKKTIEKELAKIRNRIKSSAVRDIMELFQKEKMFTTIFERMGEENMTDLTMKIDREQNIEGMYADFVFTILNERKQVKAAKEQAEKEREEKEEMKNRLIQIFGTDDLDEIKKMRESNL